MSAPPRRRGPHPFDVDTGVPPDHRNRSYCRWCGLPGTPGDARHPHDAPAVLPPASPEAAELDRRRLGERQDVEDPDAVVIPFRRRQLVAVHQEGA